VNKNLRSKVFIFIVNSAMSLGSSIFSKAHKFADTINSGMLKNHDVNCCVKIEVIKVDRK